MVVQVDNTKINKQSGLNGADSGQSVPYLNPAQKHFANGGSIFTAPGAQPQSSAAASSSSSGFWGMLSGAEKGTEQAGSGSNNSSTDSAEAQKGAEEATRLQAKFVSSVKVGLANINKGGQDLVALNKQTAQTDKDIQDLTSQRDAAAAEAESGSTDAAGNPFDGTGSGAGSANNISGIGAGDNTQPQTGGSTQSGLLGGAHVKAAVRPGADTTDTTPTPQASGSGSTGNSEAQAKVDDLNSQLDGKMTQKEQVDQKIQNSMNALKANYKSQIAPLKADGAVLDKKSSDADGKIKGAQGDQQTAGTVTTVGGTTTGAGTALIATGSSSSVASMGSTSWMVPLGTKMVYAGGAATVGGAAWNMKAKAAETSANNEKTATTTAKTNLVAQEKLIVTSYAKAMNKARQA